MSEEINEQFDDYQEKQDEHNESNKFEATYGFEHECRCADDWAEGNVGLVSNCYLGMAETAMDVLAATRKELTETKTQLVEVKLGTPVGTIEDTTEEPARGA